MQCRIALRFHRAYGRPSSWGVLVSMFFLIVSSCFLVSILCSYSSRPLFMPLQSRDSMSFLFDDHLLTVSSLTSTISAAFFCVQPSSILLNASRRSSACVSSERERKSLVWVVFMYPLYHKIDVFGGLVNKFNYEEIHPYSLTPPNIIACGATRPNRLLRAGRARPLLREPLVGESTNAPTSALTLYVALLSRIPICLRAFPPIAHCNRGALRHIGMR